MHAIAAVRHARIAARRARDLECSRVKACPDGSTSRAKILAVAAPTHARGNRRFSAFPANRTAKAPACHCHLALRVQRRVGAVARIVLLGASSAVPLGWARN
jgi:hypothetical protein